MDKYGLRLQLNLSSQQLEPDSTKFRISHGFGSFDMILSYESWLAVATIPNAHLMYI